MRLVRDPLFFVLVRKLRKRKQVVSNIVVTRFIYGQQNQVHEHIVRLVQEKRIDGITAVRDESNREVFALLLKLDASANVILNNYSKMTQMQTNWFPNL